MAVDCEIYPAGISKEEKRIPTLAQLIWCHR